MAGLDLIRKEVRYLDRAKAYLGVDIGSVTTKFAIIDESKNPIRGIDQRPLTLYIRTEGDPIKAVKNGAREIFQNFPEGYQIYGTGATGSARKLIGRLIGADVIETEIIAHAVASQYFEPDVRTIFEIGGQDSKIIILRDGVLSDFNMNSICAAGTGSFLDHQAERLKMPIQEFGDYACKAKCSVDIAGRCTVFAESDMIHKQQEGYQKDEIIKGLCEAIVRNYLNNVAHHKEIEEPIMFQGGVAANKGVKEAFEKTLGKKVIVPRYYDVMGAIGAAMLAMEKQQEKPEETKFKGFKNIEETDFGRASFNCKSCPNICQIVQLMEREEAIGRWGGRCDRWDM